MEKASRCFILYNPRLYFPVFKHIVQERKSVPCQFYLGIKIKWMFKIRLSYFIVEKIIVKRSNQYILRLYIFIQKRLHE